MKSKKEGIFISHINEESQVAHATKRLLKEVFGYDLKVFVSSDYDSLGGGDKWFATILENIKNCQIVLALISPESYYRPWIPYEAGVGEGAGATVIPLVHRNTAIRDLSPPLSEYHVRNLQDANSVLALMDDIGKEIGQSPSRMKVKSLVKQFVQLEMESLPDLTKPGPGVIRAWVDTLITPLLKRLRNEQDSLTNQKWKWNKLSDRFESIHSALSHLSQESRPDLRSYQEFVDEEIRDRLEQFEKYYPDIRKAIDVHDRKAKDLLESCNSVYQVVRTSSHLLKIYKRITVPESLGATEATVDKIFGTPAEGSHLDTLAEYIVSHTDDLPSHYSTSKLWNRHKGVLLGVLERPSIRRHHCKAIRTGEELLQSTKNLIGLLKKVREELSTKFDIPY